MRQLWRRQKPHARVFPSRTVFGATVRNPLKTPMLPISLRVEGHRALIVGGGAVALRKTESLLAAGMTITVVAPRIDTRLSALATCSERAYESSDMRDVTL